MRTGAPIYTTREILQECGFVIDESQIAKKPANHADEEPAETPEEELTLEELEERRSAAEEREDYEEAARLTEIINHKKED